MNDFLPKPFSYDELTQKVAQWASTSSYPEFAEKQRRSDLCATTDVAEPAADYREIQGRGNNKTMASVLDETVLDKLRTKKQYRQRNLVSRVVQSYLHQTPKMLEELEHAGAQSDSEALVHIAHTLKSSSLTVGATKFAAVCKEIEEQGASGTIEFAKIESLVKNYAEVESALEDVLEKDK